MRFLPVLTMCGAIAFGAAPKTKVEPVTETIHGVTITDPYRWLENQDSSETRAWIDQQIQYTDSMLKDLDIRARLRNRLTELLTTERVNAPVERGGRYFYSKRAPGEDQYVTYVRKGLTGRDEVLVDPNPMSADHTISAGLAGVSHDGSLAAIYIRQGGEDEITLRFIDVDTREQLADALPKARYLGVAILPDKSGFYYGVWTAKGPRIRFHKFGAAEAEDATVFGEGYGVERILHPVLSDDGRWLAVVNDLGSAGRQTEISVKRLDQNRPFETIVKGVEARFAADIGGDALFVQTDWNAPNGRVLAIDLNNPARDRWKEIVPEREFSLESISLIGGRIALSYLENVHTRIDIVAAGGKHVRTIRLPGIGTAYGPEGRWDGNEAFYTFTSFGQPPVIFHYDVETGESARWYETKAPFDSSAIEVEQVWYESKDNTRVPMFLVHKRGLVRDGKRPVFLTGYGGFAVAELPAFSATAVIWSEFDGVFALPALRGGSEFGEKWHRAGQLENKQKVFDDFIAAAEWLIANKYTNPSRLAIAGSSNGGLLVGAALTQRPDLFQAVICGAPLLDMIRYHKFKVARFWVPEYGSSDDPQQFKFIYQYSPYHHVKKGVKYPAVMLMSGDADTRVDPLHARKMAALLQASTASDRPVLLHYDVKAGHSGGLPITRSIQNQADELAFLAWQLGMK
jgi:prolyl oligopeptidase